MIKKNSCCCYVHNISSYAVISGLVLVFLLKQAIEYGDAIEEQ